MASYEFGNTCTACVDAPRSFINKMEDDTPHEMGAQGLDQKGVH